MSSLATRLELVAVHLTTGQKLGIAGFHNNDLAQHLTRDDLDVLVVDVYTLGHVHVLDLGNDVAQRGVRVGQTQQVVRVHRTLGELLANLHSAAVDDARQHLRARRNDVLAEVALVCHGR